jgi:hypothetical protein
MSESSDSNPELREQAVAYPTTAGEADLEFSVEPGFDSRPPQLSPADYVNWCEEMLMLFPPKPDRAAVVAKAGCRVEFVL